MKMQNKWLALLGMAITLGGSLYGMENQNKEFFQSLGELPVELQQRINQLAMQDAIIFLSGQPLTTLEHPDPITSLAIDNNNLISGSTKGIVRVWDINGKLKFSFKPYDDWVSLIALDDNILVTGTEDNIVKIWNIDTRKLVRKLQDEEDEGGFIDVGISDDIIITQGNYTSAIWSINGEKLKQFDETGAIAINKKAVIIAFIDGSIQKWDKKTGELSSMSEAAAGHNKALIDRLAVSDKFMVTISRGGEGRGMVQIWDIIHNKLVSRLNLQDYSQLVMNDDFVVITSSDGSVKVLSAKTGELLRTFKEGPIRALAIKDNVIAIGYFWDNIVKIWPILPMSGNPLNENPQTNPLAWIVKNSNQPQADLINRAYEATVADKEFIIEFPSEDAKVFLSFPSHVQRYLADRLKIRR